MRHLDGAFWWAFSAFIAIVLMHVIFWLITPAGEQILAKNENVTSAGMRFFGLQRADRSAEAEKSEAEWKAIRAHREYSHHASARLQRGWSDRRPAGL